MRIAITLQSWHHLGGIGIYTQQIVPHLIEMDKQNEYFLVYPSFGQAHQSFGQFSGYANVTEILSTSFVPHGIYWDQLVVPRVMQKYGIDLLFNPLQSVPLRGRFRKVLTLHNSEWFIMPEVFGTVEKLNGKALLKPIMRAADLIISVSHKVAEDLEQATNLPKEKLRVIHNGWEKKFRRITDVAILHAAKKKYTLPDDFLLFVGGIYPQKNFNGLVKAFSQIARDIPHQLVVAGNPRWKSEDDINVVKQLGIDDKVQFLGWVNRDDLVALYSLATCFVIPSFHESCSLALLEALSCGCPVIASNTGGNPEVVGEAALSIDPHDLTALQEAIRKMVSSPELRQQLSQQGLDRVQDWTWEKSAAETLRVLHEFSN
jgi:glycosyltransferase involved in cell wall biosynthesis